MQALLRQQQGNVTKVRRRSARQAVETRRERGDVLGNPAALARARKKKR